MSTMKRDWDERIPDHILMKAIFLRVARPSRIPSTHPWRYAYRCLRYDPNRKACRNYERRPYICRSYLCDKAIPKEVHDVDQRKHTSPGVERTVPA